MISDDPDDPWPEDLVVLCGPPCAGKTALALRHTDHVRITFEGDRSQSASTLHSKSKIVKKRLSKGTKLCLDDQHESKDYRKNVLSGSEVSSRGKRALCVWCEPEGGRPQCVWANEWNMASAAEAGAGGEVEYMPLAWSEASADAAYGSKHKRSLERWFAGGSHVVGIPPSSDELLAEGFDRVLRLNKLPLCRMHHGSFRHAGLVIDGDVVLEDRGEGAVVPN